MAACNALQYAWISGETWVNLIEVPFSIELDVGIFNKAIQRAGFAADIASRTTVQQFEVADVVLEQVYKKDLSYLKVYGKRKHPKFYYIATKGPSLPPVDVN